MLVVAGEGWHRGVIGIVASKLVDAYHKPALVLSIQDGVATGSGRSIRAFDLLAGLEACGDVFLRFGGHKLAAGVTLEAGRIDELRRRLSAYANERLGPDDLVPRLRIDAPLGLGDISGDVVQALGRLGPVRRGQSRSRCSGRRPSILAAAPRRLKERHLSLVFRQGNRSFRAIAWRAARARGLPDGQPVRPRAGVLARCRASTGASA